MKPSDLTGYAIDGYHNHTRARCPHLESSPAFYAWQIGAMLQRTGRTTPADVRMGRGYQVHANGMLWAFDSRNAITRVK